MPVLFADAAHLHRERLATAPGQFSARCGARIEPGLTMTRVEYAGCRRWLEGWRRACAAFFQDDGRPRC